MLYNHDVMGLQQNRTYIHHAFFACNRARMALWDVQYVNLRLNQTFGFNTLHNLTAFAFFFLFLTALLRATT